MNNKIKNWIDKNIKVDLKNKNVFITGSNSGIGFETAKECAYLGANIFMCVRNIEKGEKAKEEILNEYPNTNITIIKLDLASLASIREAVNEIKKYDVDIFINNAGVFRLPKGDTIDGFEITMGTNFIGTLYLNDLLNKYFVTLNHEVKNIFTTSITSKISHIDYNDFYHLKSYRPLQMYARSKVAINNLYFAYLEEYGSTNISFSLVHPGGTYTPLITKAYRNKAFEKVASIFMKIVFHTPEKAALTNIKAIDSDFFVGPRGLFEISGYPKHTTFRRSNKYKDCIDFARKEIKHKL